MSNEINERLEIENLVSMFHKSNSFPISFDKIRLQEVDKIRFYDQLRKTVMDKIYV